MVVRLTEVADHFCFYFSSSDRIVPFVSSEFVQPGLIKFDVGCWGFNIDSMDGGVSVGYTGDSQGLKDRVMG